MILVQSSSVSAIGFSMRRCLPCCAARVCAQIFDAWIALGGKIDGKLPSRIGTRVGARHQHDPGIACKSWQHDAECAAQPGNAKTKLTLTGVSHRQDPALSVVLS